MFCFTVTHSCQISKIKHFKKTYYASKIARAGLFKAGLRYPTVSAKFEFRYESLKIKFSLIPFVSKLMIGCS